jgi:hypothetical protein
MACFVVSGQGAGLSAQKALFQWAVAHGVENRATFDRVPVVAGNGSTKYYDVLLAFNVDAGGKLTLNPTASRIALSPTVLVGAFKPGEYENDGCRFVVGAPGLTADGRAIGSIGLDEFCGEFNATWVSGPIAGHPNEAALRAAGISSTAFSWGVMGDETGRSNWSSGDLIGVAQSGSNLTIVNFGSDARQDSTLVFRACINGC